MAKTPKTPRPFKTTAKTPEGILKAAARLIRERGWIQGMPFGDDGEFDLSASISYVVGNNDQLYTTSIQLLKKRIGIGPEELIFVWNDKSVRKVEEVLAVLEGKQASA